MQRLEYLQALAHSCLPFPLFLVQVKLSSIEKIEQPW